MYAEDYNRIGSDSSSILEIKQFEMQVRYDSNMPSNISILKHVTHYSSERALQKCASLPCVSDTTDSSSASIESQEEEYRQQAVRWMLSATRRVAKDTNYLALSYFNRLMKHSIPINE